MFELHVEREFCAAHAIVINGEREALHGHNWRVTTILSGAQLDGDGLLCDFHEVEAHIDACLAPFHNVSLNDVPPFTQVNPTAECVARHLAESIAERLPAGVRVESVRVTESPGCAALYRRPTHA